MKRLLIFPLLTLISLQLLSAPSVPAGDALRVTGIVADSLTQEGEPGANLHVFAAADASHKAVSMGISRVDGTFSLSLPHYGTYCLAVSSVGRRSLQRTFHVSKAQPQADLGILLLRDSTEMLQTVEVVAQKPLVKMDIDEISYSVADDPDAKTNNTLEMLRKVPMVTVDGEDNIKVNGSSSFQVYVNGKPNAMMSANPSQTLKAIPASSIKSIEVLTNPGAKYDAEGVGGILNITMESHKGLEGYTLNLNALGSNLAQGGGAYVMTQSGRLTLSANLNATHIRIPDTKTTNLRDGQDGSRMDYTGKTYGHSTLLFGNFDASYEIDSLNSLSASVGLFHMPQRLYGNATTQMSLNGHPYLDYATHISNRTKSLSVNGSLDYRHTFRNNPNHYLLLAYRISTQPKRTDAASLFSIDGSSEAAWAQGLTDRYSTDRNNMTEHTFQADYTLPLDQKQEVETGMKYILRRSTSENEETDYRHRSGIAAAYGNYNLRAGRFGMKAGVRYEHTRQKVRFLSGNGENFNVNYNNVVPALSLSYRLNHGQQVGAGYNLRISRPGIGFLNPYVNRQDPTHITYGNPALEPEKAHNLNLNYSLFTNKFMLNAALRHTLLNNGMEEYTRNEDNVLYTTYGNIGRRRATELSLFLNWSITPQTRLTVNSTTSYTDLRAASLGFHNYGWQESLMAGLQHTFPCKLRISANYFCNTSGVTLQGKSGGFSMHTLGISRSFLTDDRLNVALTAVNPFYDKVKITSDTKGTDFTNRSRIQMSLRSVALTVSFRIGNLKPQKKVRTATASDIRDRQDTTTPLNCILLPDTK